MNSDQRYAELSNDQLRQVHAVCQGFEETFRDGETPRIEAHLETAAAPLRTLLFRELLAIELEMRTTHGPITKCEEYEARFPDRINEIRLEFSERLPLPNRIETPRQIGRYRIEKILGAGGFGTVYAAYDVELRRAVAMKVPHRKLNGRSQNVDVYMEEAQAVARLDHPHIVPVYDVGKSDESRGYIVSKYIAGSNLALRLKQGRLPWQTAATLVADIADALYHAHEHGLIHRDVKPGNILLDEQQSAYLVDFGLALIDSDAGPRCAGTPAYMSPEQALGEGHCVDGRSDIYSLGAVFYELLSGRRTFSSTSPNERLELIAHHEPVPPRQLDDSIPKELERICLKAIAKDKSDRYATAQEMSQEIRRFLGSRESRQSISLTRIGKLAAGVGGIALVLSAVLMFNSWRTTSRYFSESFASSTPPAQFELSGYGWMPTYDGAGVIFNGQEDGHRTFLRTIRCDYHNVDFVAEITTTIASIPGESAIAFFGLGEGQSGKYGVPQAPPAICAMINPTGFHPQLSVSDDAIPADKDITVAGDGTHRVRFTWSASKQQAVVSLDQDYIGGPFEADSTLATIDGSDNGFDATNSRIFFGGNLGVRFNEFDVQAGATLD